MLNNNNNNNRFSATWSRTSTLRYSPQLSRCAEALARNSELEQDRHLAWLVRLQYIFEELVEVQRNFDRGPRDHQSEMQRNLIRAGLEAQFRDFKDKMPGQYASTSKSGLDALCSLPFFFFFFSFFSHPHLLTWINMNSHQQDHMSTIFLGGKGA